jgi:hypothetical protein
MFYFKTKGLICGYFYLAFYLFGYWNIKWLANQGRLIQGKRKITAGRGGDCRLYDANFPGLTP